MTRRHPMPTHAPAIVRAAACAVLLVLVAGCGAAPALGPAEPEWMSTVPTEDTVRTVSLDQVLVREDTGERSVGWVRGMRRTRAGDPVITTWWKVYTPDWREVGFVTGRGEARRWTGDPDDPSVSVVRGDVADGAAALLGVPRGSEMVLRRARAMDVLRQAGLVSGDEDVTTLESGDGSDGDE